MNRSVSMLAPIFAAAGLYRHQAHTSLYAFFVGFSASAGAGISMGLAEALSDDGTVTGRGNPWARGLTTGVATCIGGMLHSFPFLISNLNLALHAAYVVVAIELLDIANIRDRVKKTPVAKTVGQVIIGGGIVFAIGLAPWSGVERARKAVAFLLMLPPFSSRPQ